MAKEYANHVGYTDVNPFEVLVANTAKMKTIRSMKAELKPDWKRDFEPGGFFGHTYNNGGEWNIEPDEKGEVIKIRLHKTGQWKDKHGRRYRIADHPVKYYDYNF